MGFFTNSSVKNINIGDGVKFLNNRMVNLFASCTSFNGIVNIENTVTNIFQILYQCRNFNSPIEIPNSVVDMQRAFYAASNFDQPLTIPNSVTNMAYALALSKFNQPIIIPESVKNMLGCFNQCQRFNHPLNIPDSVTDAGMIFSSCGNLNCPITFGNGVTSIQGAFSNCNNFSNNISIFSKNVTSARIMLGGRVRNNSKRVNIHVPAGSKTYNAMLINTSDSIVGNTISWTGTSYKYNSQWNIYIYPDL